MRVHSLIKITLLGLLLLGADSGTRAFAQAPDALAMTAGAQPWPCTSTCSDPLMSGHLAHRRNQ